MFSLCSLSLVFWVTVMDSCYVTSVNLLQNTQIFFKTFHGLGHNLHVLLVVQIKKAALVLILHNI